MRHEATRVTRAPCLPWRPGPINLIVVGEVTCKLVITAVNPQEKGLFTLADTVMHAYDSVAVVKVVLVLSVMVSDE